MGNINPEPHERRDGAPTQADAVRALAPLALAYLAADQLGYGDVKQQLRELARRDPIDSLLLTVLGGGLAFYLLEREKNPAIEGYWDAALYVATSLSVGYDNLFPKTELGNALATAIHTFGPSLTSAALQPPAEAPTPDDELLAVNRAILARLDEIASLLQQPR